MYPRRLRIFAAIAAAILLSIPAANLALRGYLGGALWPRETRDLWSLDRVEGNLAYLLMSCCETSLAPDRVRIGREGYLFLGDKFEDVMHKTSGAWQPPEGLIDARAAQLARLQRRIESAGATLTVAIAPNKHSVYPEMLPEDVTPAPQTTTDDVIARAAEAGLSILDLRPVLQRLKPSVQVYMQTDTHWTRAAAAVAYDSHMEALRDSSGAADTPIRYSLEPVQRPAGDLAGLLKMQDLYAADFETDYTIQFETPLNSCIAEINVLSGVEGACVPTASGEVSAGRSVQVTRTAGAPNEQTLLMLCDSFCHAGSSLFTASFTTVYHAHWKHLDDTALERHLAAFAPDIVILQMVERDVAIFSLGRE